jgi:hypothetical protein
MKSGFVQKRKINITNSPIILPVLPIFPSVSSFIPLLLVQKFQKGYENERT